MATSAVLEQLSPTVIRVTMGASSLTAWSHLPAPWTMIALFEGPAGSAMLPASPGQQLMLDWRSPDGEFTFIVTPSKLGAVPLLDWSLAATPPGVDVQAQLFNGTF